MMNRNRFIAFLLIMMLVAFASIAESQDAEVKRPTIRKRVEQNDQVTASRNRGRRIASLEFRGNEKFSSDTILRFMRLVKPGDLYNKEKLENDLLRVRALLYADRGYLKAQFGEPETEETGEGLRIVIPFEEGLPYRFGEIKVEDATVFSPDEIIEIIGAKSGDIVKGYSVIQTGLDRLKKLYGNRGYIQFFASPQIEYRQATPYSEEGIADVTFEIEEGAMYFLRRVEFTGNLTVRDEEIWDKLRLNI
ncbi:MAG: POTRA domain-containing protein, partial [Acidobacteriota bacterium]